MELSELFGWLIVFIIGSLIISFILSPNSFYSFKSNIKELISSSSNQQANSYNNEKVVSKAKEEISKIELVQICPDYIIPNKIITKMSSSDYVFQGQGFYNSWKDGTEIKNIPEDFPSLYVFDDYCHWGAKEGENVNYLYCSDLYYENIVKDISSTGVINSVEDRKYLVNLVLKPLGSYEVSETLTITSEMVEPYIERILNAQSLEEKLAIQLEILLANGIYVIPTRIDEKYLYTQGEVWLKESDNILKYQLFKNYSVESSNCEKYVLI